MKPTRNLRAPRAVLVCLLLCALCLSQGALTAGVDTAETGSLTIQNNTDPGNPIDPDDPPPGPDDPDNPPDNPDNPDKPNKPNKPSKPSKPTLPQTGRLNWPIPLLAAAGLGLFAGGWYLWFGKKDGHEE